MTNNVSERFKTDIVPMLGKNDVVKAAMKDFLLTSIASKNSWWWEIPFINVKQKDPTLKNFQDCFYLMKAHTVLETVKEKCGADANTGNVSITGMPSRLSWLPNEGTSRNK